MMNNDIRFKKIHALISEDLFNNLVSRNMFNTDWDYWLSQAIREKLEREI